MRRSNSQRKEVLKYVLEKYGTSPEFLWESNPDSAALRHSDNRKWYGLIMSVNRANLGLKGSGTVDVLNLKCDPAEGGSLVLNAGIIPAYHMNKKAWISVILDGTVEMCFIEILIDTSFDLTAPRLKRTAPNARITEWIVPANPKFYNIEKAIAESRGKGFLWKQSSRIAVGDTVYLYVAAPVSGIKYKCEVLEANIPYEYSDENVRMSRVMKLKLVRRYDKTPVSFALLKEHGVNAVRGPRGIPKDLVRAIEKMYPDKQQ